MQDCDRCDNCRRKDGTRRESHRLPTEDEREEIHKVLTGISRLNGRFGRTRICPAASRARPNRQPRRCSRRA